MAKILLDKYKNDPAWAETIKLYSGLFDATEERETFLSNLIESDIILAVECESASIKEEVNIQKEIVTAAENHLIYGNTNKIPYLVALAKLNQINQVLNYTFKINPNNNFKKIVKELFDKTTLEFQYSLIYKYLSVRSTNSNSISILIKSTLYQANDNVEELFLKIIPILVKRKGIPKKHQYIKRILSNNSLSKDFYRKYFTYCLYSNNFVQYKLAISKLNVLNEEERNEWRVKFEANLRIRFPKVNESLKF
jgi:hypothetical protein